VELKADSARLHLELEQARQALAKADSARSSLSTTQNELKCECTKLRTGSNVLKQEKAKIMTNHEADLAAEWKKYRDYRLSHRRKLHDLRVELE
jgi:flagellin-like hook-associated protein FlgL